MAAPAAIRSGGTRRKYARRMRNTLYYGDNLHVLRRHVANESV